MLISPIAAIGPLASAGSVSPTAAAGSNAAAGGNFATELTKGLDAVSGAQSNADNLAIQASTGTLSDPASYTIAATQASMMTELASAVQSKAVAAFNTIMGMQA